MVVVVDASELKVRIAHLEMMGRWKGVSEIHFLHCTASAKNCEISLRV